MHLGRYERGQYKVFHCERCRRQITRRVSEQTGYNGSLVISSRIPLRHQD